MSKKSWILFIHSGWCWRRHSTPRSFMRRGQWQWKENFAMCDLMFYLSLKICNCRSLDYPHSLTAAEWGLTGRGQGEPLVVPFRASNSSWNQSACSAAAVFMAQPCGPPLRSLVLLPVWKMHSQVPHTLWVLSCVFWDTEPHIHKNITFPAAESNRFWSGRSE